MATGNAARNGGRARFYKSFLARGRYVSNNRPTRQTPHARRIRLDKAKRPVKGRRSPLRAKAFRRRRNPRGWGESERRATLRETPRTRESCRPG